MVTLPMRSSFTSRRRSSVNSRWICSPRRRARGLSFAMSAPAFLQSGGGTLQRACHLHPRVTLDLIALAHIVVVLHADAALGSGAHLVDVVLEALQRLERSFEDHHVVAQYADG